MKCYIVGQELSFDAEEIIFNKVRLLIKWGVKEFYSRGENNFEKLCEKVAEKQGARVIHIKTPGPEEYSAVLCNFCDCEEEVIEQRLDAYEADEKFTLEFINPEEAIYVNRNEEHGPKDKNMIERETKVLELLMKEGYFK